MATHFANVVNVQSTREQVDLFFGTNQTWNVADSGRGERRPHQPHHPDAVRGQAALAVLGGVLREYESRHGPLNLTPIKRPKR